MVEEHHRSSLAWLKEDAGLISSGVCTVLAVTISMWQILCHLRNYTEPTYQRYILRVIFLVPSYSAASWCSLKLDHYSIYFDTIRDCYEAWVIYNFMALCLAYVGGPGAVVVKAEGTIIQPSWKWMTCCLPPMMVDGFLLRRCKQGTLQFVLLKPMLAAFTLLCFAAGRYQVGNWSPSQGYLWVSIIYNICYTVALYSLLLFYIGTEELLHPYKPLLKFICIKTVIFLTFWQGLGISMVASWGAIDDPEYAEALQNYMITVEMLAAAFMMLAAFPVKEYKIGGQAQGFKLRAMAHAISLKDVWTDFYHQFSGTYYDYVLYSDGGPADNVKQSAFRGGNKKKKGMSRTRSANDFTQTDGNIDDKQGQKNLAKERRQADLLASDSDDDHEFPAPPTLNDSPPRRRSSDGGAVNRV